MIGPTPGCVSALTGAGVDVAWKTLAGVTNFTLKKSTNGGRTYTTLIVIPNVTTDSHYSAVTGLFTYSDATGALGHLYLLEITDGLRAGMPCLVTPKPAPALTIVSGLIQALDGGPPTEAERIVDILPFDTGSADQGGIANAVAGLLRSRVTVHADASTGLWVVSLVGGQVVEIRVRATGVSRVIRVPMDATRTYDLSKLPNDRISRDL